MGDLLLKTLRPRHFGAAVVTLLASCGPDPDPGLRCGARTVEHDGECVAIDAGADSDADVDTDSDTGSDPCPDADGDAHPDSACGGDDCNDEDPGVYAGAPDPAGDCLDQNCDLVDGPDQDIDGHVDSDCGGDDCDDLEPDFHPDAADIVGDGADQNCDRLDGIDADSDGYASEASGGTDCDDTVADVHPGAIDEAWTIESVDEAFAGDHGTSLAVDDAGVVHLSYVGDGSLIYATKAGGAWETEVVEDNVGHPTSLAVDDAGDVHVAQASSGVGLRHAVRRGAADWEVETVDPLGRDGASMAISGSIHIAFRGWDAGFGALRLMSAVQQEDGTWGLEVAVPSGAGEYLAIGDTENIAYESLAGELDLATNSAGWTSVAVDSDGGSYVSAATDAAGAIHLFYSAAGEVRSATNAGGGWTIEAVDDHGSFGALALDAGGAVHVTYSAQVVAGQLYATNMSGVWSVESIDPDNGGGDADLAVASDGSVHVAFSVGGDEIRYATRAAQNGVDDDCNGVTW